MFARQRKGFAEGTSRADKGRLQKDIVLRVSAMPHATALSTHSGLCLYDENGTGDDPIYGFSRLW